MIHQGSCHCGRIAYEVDADITQVMECNCSHCARKGYLLWFGPRTALRLTTPAAELRGYTFNRHVIEHQFCPVCGCAPFAFGKDRQGVDTVAVNVRCLPALELSNLTVKQVDGRRL